MKKLIFLFLILIVVSSCSYNENIRDSPKKSEEVVVDVSRFQEGRQESGGRSEDYGYPVNMPTYLNWGNELPGMDKFHSQSFVSPKQSQGDFGTCWAFAAVAVVESHYLLTHSPGTSAIDIAELGVLFGCPKTECYWREDHPCYGGATREMLDWMSKNPIPLETSLCFPYDDLEGGYSDCWCSNCDLHYFIQNGGQGADPYSCNYIDLDFSWDHKTDPPWDFIKETLWQYGPVAGSFKSGYVGSHVMLIYGYDERNGNRRLIVKDTSSHNYEYEDFQQDDDPDYIDWIDVPVYHNLDCYSEDGDAYKWWGIGATADGYEKPCDGGWPEPDCFDGLADVSQCRFSCNDDGEWNEYTEEDSYDEPSGGPGATCDPWESCSTCFDDCYIPEGDRSTDACAGDGVCEGEENCITSPYDCGPCPECSDRIDNDGDGLIDYQGYILDGEGRDPGCNSFGDNSEYEDPLDCYDDCSLEGCEGMHCGEGMVCEYGACVLDCPDDWFECSGECVDPMTDENHCGGCNIPCETSQKCINGQCMVVSGGGPKMEMQNPPPGGWEGLPLNAPEEESIWDWLKCLIIDCNIDDDWEPSEG